MRIRFFSLMLTIAAIICSCSNAQNTKNADNDETADTLTEAATDEDVTVHDDDECAEYDDYVPVSFKGDKPTIVDFANAFLNIEDIGEGFTGLSDALARYEHGQKPEYGELIVDKANGYISYTVDWNTVDPETKQTSTNEMCFWNCKDGQHKIFCSNVKVTDEGKYIQTEVTGLTFLRYDSNTRQMEWYSADQLGALVVAPDLCWPVQDRDNHSLGSDDWGRYDPIATLPRTGKTIYLNVADTSLPTSKYRTCELIWNGNGFDKKFSK